MFLFFCVFITLNVDLSKQEHETRHGQIPETSAALSFSEAFIY